jgi:hypothetical protein
VAEHNQVRVTAHKNGVSEHNQVRVTARKNGVSEHNQVRVTARKNGVSEHNQVRVTARKNGVSEHNQVRVTADKNGVSEHNQVRMTAHKNGVSEHTQVSQGHPVGWKMSLNILIHCTEGTLCVTAWGGLWLRNQSTSVGHTGSWSPLTFCSERSCLRHIGIFCQTVHVVEMKSRCGAQVAEVVGPALRRR